jgi:hypothetical protein
MTRSMNWLAVVLTTFLALSAAPASAANCFWSNGTYKCYDRAGRVYVANPRVDSSRQYRPRERYVQPRPYVPSEGSGMGSFTYGCTLARC